jgi:hypothetical protein
LRGDAVVCGEITFYGSPNIGDIAFPLAHKEALLVLWITKKPTLGVKEIMTITVENTCG